jgi:hypothetical protein
MASKIPRDTGDIGDTSDIQNTAVSWSCGIAADSADDAATARTEIATNGDVVLVAGPHGKKIQVSSSALRTASTYFGAMFGPRFAEGQGLNSNGPKEILMPDDNANAVEVICNIMHFRNEAIPQSLSPTEVFEIAVAADKFNCVVALKHASAIWLNPDGVKSITELAYLMAAAYIFDNAQAFSRVTLAMVLRHTGSYLPLAEQLIDLFDFVPGKILCKYHAHEGL